MGAEAFVTVSRLCNNADEAYKEVLQDARWEHGHGGYTGTIAEKNGYYLVPKPHGMRPETIEKAVWELFHRYDEKAYKYWRRKLAYDVYNTIVDAWDADKWGPAACMKVTDRAAGKNKYLFFGMASS